MWVLALAILAFVAASTSGVKAAWLDDIEGWYRHARSLVESPTHEQVANQPDVIVPPVDIDPKMAVKPPEGAARTPIIRPPSGNGGGKEIVPK